MPLVILTNVSGYVILRNFRSHSFALGFMRSEAAVSLGGNKL